MSNPEKSLNIISIEKSGYHAEEFTFIFPDGGASDEFYNSLDQKLDQSKTNYILRHFGGKNTHTEFSEAVALFKDTLKRKLCTEYDIEILPISANCTEQSTICATANKLYNTIKNGELPKLDELEKFRDDFYGCNEEVKKKIVLSLLPLWLHVERTIRFRKGTVSDDVRDKVKEALVDIVKLEGEELWASKCMNISENLTYLVTLVKKENDDYMLDSVIDPVAIGDKIRKIIKAIQK